MRLYLLGSIDTKVFAWKAFPSLKERIEAKAKVKSVSWWKNTKSCRGTAGSFPFLGLTGEINHHNYGPARGSRDRSPLSLPSSRCFPIVWVSSAVELRRGQWDLDVPWTSVKREQASGSCANVKESFSSPHKCLSVMTKMSADISPRFQPSTSFMESSLYPFVSLVGPSDHFFHLFLFIPVSPLFPLPSSLSCGGE